MTEPAFLLPSSPSEEFLRGMNHAMSASGPLTRLEAFGRLAGFALPVLIALIAARNTARMNRPVAPS